jgi:hypothetical protein
VYEILREREHFGDLVVDRKVMMLREVALKWYIKVPY